MFGTSQATPHIAGSVAVLKGATAFPVDTADATLARMTGTGVLVLDSKSGITKPRIDLLAAFGNASPTYSISGTVTANSAGLAGVSMTLTGGTITTTNSLGAYTFAGLGSGVTYTVTPSKSGYTFVPTNRAVQISNANVTGQDFAATASCTAPGVPSRVSATAGSGRVTIKWTASSGAVTYNVKRSTTSGGSYVTIASGVTTTSYTDTAVTRGKTYYYVVSAVSACGAESANSSRVSAKPR
jgi:cellulose 1,4-beta-cellobiosidase